MSQDDLAILMLASVVTGFCIATAVWWPGPATTFLAAFTGLMWAVTLAALSRKGGK